MTIMAAPMNGTILLPEEMLAFMSDTQSKQETPIPKKSYDLRIFQALRRIIRAIDIHSHKLATQYKITGPQLSCLLALDEEGTLTSANLAKKVHLSPSTVVGIVDRLEEKKLATRKRASQDRRQVHISITSTGKELLASSPSLLEDSLSTALGALPETEQVAMTMAVEKLVNLLEAQDIGAAPVLETGSLTSEQ